MLMPRSPNKSQSSPDLHAGQDSGAIANVTQRKRKQPDCELTLAIADLSSEFRKTIDDLRADINGQFSNINELNENLMLCMWCKAAMRRALAVFKLALESETSKQNDSPTNERPKRLHTLNFIHNLHIDIPPLFIEYHDYKTENVNHETEEIMNPLQEIPDNDEISLKSCREIMKTTDLVNEESLSSKDCYHIENRFSTKERNKKTMESTNIRNKESISKIEQEHFKNEIAALKRNKKTMKSTDILNKELISNVELEILQNGKSTKKRKKKDVESNELKFEVKYLNFEEQLKELELKKLKYKDFKFQCDECGMGFLTSDIFDEHKVRHSKLSGDHKCVICSLHFKSRDVLSQHLLAHRRRYHCSLCVSVFTRWTHCVAHSYKCGAVVTPTACAYCGKLFSNEYSLKIHMKVHKTEKKYSCDQCDKRFGSKHRLTVHMRSHSGIKPFSCLLCSLAFTTRSNLRAHSAVHDPTSQFYCVECHTYYKTEKSLKRHYKESSKHVGLKSDMYSCKECSKQFSTEKSLSHHIRTRHGTEHRCSQCDKTFSNNSNLNKHIKCIHTAK